MKTEMKLVILNEKGNIPSGWITDGKGTFVKLPIIDNKYRVKGYYFCADMSKEIQKYLEK